MSNIIFVRERRKVEKGEKRPRFRVVGTIGDIRIVAEHMRKCELDEIAKVSGTQVVFLSSDGEGKEGMKKGD
ncbi:MAG: hypothetical protein GXY42_11210 [Desulfovibrionales bacterium]|nr:hypothetical protein [Desulfovibrionales bacterium]